MKNKKFYKIISNNKGSTLIYVLMIFLFLSILTTSLIFSTITSYKIGIEKGGRNVSFYIADGAIDEFLTEIEEITHRAEVIAIDTISKAEEDDGEDDTNFLNNTQWKKFNHWLETKLALDEITVDESVQYKEKALKKEFDKIYLMNILESPTLEEDYTLIDDENNFVEGNDFEISVPSASGIKNAYINDLKSVEFIPSNFDGFEDVDKPTLEITKNLFSDMKINLVVKTDGTYNLHKKAIEMSIDIIPPKYNYAFKSIIKRKTIYVNAINNNSITAMKDINIFGGSVVSNGNIYSYGTFPEKSRYSTFEKGGIVIGYNNNENDYLDLTGELSILNSHLSDIEKNGSLIVNGDVYTRSNIKLFDDSSNLKVSGNLYADGFVVEKDSSNSNIAIDKNAYIMDDFFINGNNSNIKIGTINTQDGELWTFLDGINVNDSGTQTKSDLSGSLRVSRDVSGTNIDLNKIFLSGIAHISISRLFNEGLANEESRYYKTGESFTTENNFYFYQTKIADQEDSTELIEYKDNAEPTPNSYYVVEAVDAGGNIEDDPEYKVDHFLTKVRDGINDGNVNIVDPADKGILSINSIDNDDNGMIDNYSLGVFLGNNKVYNPKFTMALGDIEGDRKTKIENIDLKINAFQTRDYVNSRNVDNNVDQFIDFTKNISNSITNPMNMIIFNNDENKDIFINFPTNYSIPSEAIKFSNVYDMSGLIATKGNVFIYNSNTTKDFKFTGTIISEGTVTFIGDGKKIITHDNNIIYNKIISNDNLIDAFYVETGKRPYTVIDSGSTTKSIWGNLDINVENNDEEIDLSIKGIPKKLGSSKDKETNNYELLYWKEL